MAANGRYEMRILAIADLQVGYEASEWVGYPSKAQAIAAIDNEQVAHQAMELGIMRYYDEDGNIYEIRRRY